MEQPQHLWSHLPDLCLLAVFKYIPTSEMIRSVGRVCTNWGRVQSDELRRRHVLFILGVASQDDANDDGYLLDYNHNPYGSNLIEHVRRDDDGSPWEKLPSLEQIKFNTLRVPGRVLTESFTSPLMAILPGITHLTIHQNHTSLNDTQVFGALEQIVRLIDQYAPNLISLNLHFMTWCIHIHICTVETDNNFDSSTRVYTALFDSINRLESLRHLTLMVNIRGLKHEPWLNILSRLSTLTVHYFEPSTPMYRESLHQYASTGGDLRINWTDGTSLPDMLELGPLLATKFAGASIIFVSATEYDSLRLFCDRFSSLISLELWMTSRSPMPITMLARCLSQLPHLVHLKLNFSEIPPEEQPPQLETAQVPTVRLLTLKIWPKSHLDTQRLHLNQIFPNLQVLHLTNDSYQCDECEYEADYETISNQDPENCDRIEHCIRLSRQPFRQCAKLHTVKLETCPAFELLLPQGLLTVDQL